MKVLGIHAYIHDAGACMITEDGLLNIAEERLSRIKYDASFPNKSIGYILDNLGISDINDVDMIVFDLFERQGQVTGETVRNLGYRGDLFEIRHHDAHAASAYFASPFDDAAVLIVDGAGSRGTETPGGGPPHYLNELAGERLQEVQSFYRATGNGMQLLRRTFSTPSHTVGVGFLYGVACEVLGFGKLNGGKLMGLAAYGRANKRFPSGLFIDYDGDLMIPAGGKEFEEEDHSGISEKLFAGVPVRCPGDDILPEHKDLAWYVQNATEDAMLALARNLHDMTRARAICVAGGVGLNGVANKRILDETPFEEIFIQPASNDSGIALGCALYGWHVILGNRERRPMRHAFLGHDYGNDAIAAYLETVPEIHAERPADVIERAAAEIARGKIVGWFEGGSETGPRALGHRSIFADPRRPDMKDELNRRVKKREPFRPYAPAVLENRAGEFFDYSAPSPFMLLIGHVRPEKKDLIPAVVHVDGTARVQSVNEADNKTLHDLIQAFERLTGVPMILNTSFNVSGEPIVETPEDAVKTFLGTDMDLMVMGDCLVSRA